MTKCEVITKASDQRLVRMILTMNRRLPRLKTIKKSKNFSILIHKNSKATSTCVLPTMIYGCQTWSLTKALVKKLETSQRAIERKVLNVKLKLRNNRQ